MGFYPNLGGSTSSGGGGGPVAWGDLNGNLPDQTDLQTALDSKATSAQGSLADSALQPGAAGTMTAATGWVANADSGAKDEPIPDYAAVAAARDALNLLVGSASGNIFETMAKKLKAMQADLVTYKVPNA